MLRPCRVESGGQLNKVWTGNAWDLGLLTGAICPGFLPTDFSKQEALYTVVIQD